MKAVLNKVRRMYYSIGFFGSVTSKSIVEDELVPVGEWKIRTEGDKEPELWLLCHSMKMGICHPTWYREDVLQIREYPDPPVVTEYINECNKCTARQLDYSALMDRAKRKAKMDAAHMYPEHRMLDRLRAESRLTHQYYMQYTRK